MLEKHLFAPYCLQVLQAISKKIQIHEYFSNCFLNTFISAYVYIFLWIRSYILISFFFLSKIKFCAKVPDILREFYVYLCICIFVYMYIYVLCIFYLLIYFGHSYCCVTKLLFHKFLTICISVTVLRLLACFRLKPAFNANLILKHNISLFRTRLNTSN